MIGSKKEAMEMLVSLPLSTANQVRLNNHDPGTCCEEEHQPWIEVFPMSRIKEAVEGMKAGKAKYRYVLEQDLL